MDGGGGANKWWSKKPYQLHSKSKSVSSSSDKRIEEMELALKVFLNPIIIDVISQHLPTSSLLVLRYTCKLWNNAMVPEYRQRTLNSKAPTVKIDKFKLDSVLETLSNCLENPFGGYHFISIPIASAKIQDLLVKIGNVMTRLRLDLTGLDSVDLSATTFRHLVWDQCRLLQFLKIKDERSLVSPGGAEFWNCGEKETHKETPQTLPNLRKISLSLNDENLNEETCNFPLINDLINAGVNLQIVNICSTNKRGGSILNGVILNALKQSESLNKIISIKFRNGLSISNLESLVELSTSQSANNRLSLKRLNTRQFVKRSCLVDPAGRDLLNRFLELQATSLEKLTASLTSWYGTGRISCASLVLPVMPTLNTLKVQTEVISTVSNSNDNAGHLMRNIGFSHGSLSINFPNLTKLTLKHMEWLQGVCEQDEEAQNLQSKWDCFVACLGSHSGVNQLNIQFAAIRDEYLADLAARFPNVTNLKVDLWNSICPELWRAWLKLQKMNLQIWFLMYCPKEFEMDSGLTGIPVESCKLLKGNSNAKKMKKLNWKEYKTYPGISDLHELREFNLYFMHAPDSKSYLSDLSAYCGFLGERPESTQLRKIRIFNRYNDFTLECIRDVEDALGPAGDFIPYQSYRR